ncbi:DNA-binding transcriptional LysR family regulator [Kitasatospora sp. GAS204A]|uniref:LysR family transcriptional regulator n=1 Tax=unclassified Kitasatospora TaxID=2633591 RepID=UPI002475369B|nr:LysR family transcriptional regulator [Kitasatospora sp. GAS204B]MDH6115943.1 DNA-binding transcriptional LysR family regulator [Kitasatospora sp. GAS204B]
MLDVRRLRLLRELAHRGTIAAVAEALAFSPSAVSQQLSALEREAGVALLERTGRRVALTPAAHNLVRHAEAVLAHLEQASAELAEARHGPAGPLRIGTYPSAARVVIPPALMLLAERWPELEPMVAEVDPAGVADLLRAGELDVALVHDYDFVPAPVEPGIAGEPLFAEAMYLATRTSDPGNLAAHAADPWILATPGTLCHAMTIRACQAAGFSPRIRHRADDFVTVLALVAAGQGTALVPELGLLDPPPTVHLHRLPMSRRTAITFRHGAAGHPAITAFGTAVRDALPTVLRS